MTQAAKITWDHFFYAGQFDLQNEVEADMEWGLLQPRETMFFNRNDGTLVPRRINFPDSIAREIEMRFDIATHLARRNSEVGDGTQDGRDQRVASSQTTITFKRPQRGSIDINVGYFLFRDFFKRENLQLNTLNVVI